MQSRLFRMIRCSIIIICVFPVIAGLLGVFLPAFGWFPIYGKSKFTFEILAQAIDQAGFLRSVWLSVFTALLSTFLAYWLCIFTLIYCQKLNPIWDSLVETVDADDSMSFELMKVNGMGFGPEIREIFSIKTVPKLIAYQFNGKKPYNIEFFSGSESDRTVDNIVDFLQQYKEK